jgi:hypothetical protein
MNSFARSLTFRQRLLFLLGSILIVVPRVGGSQARGLPDGTVPNGFGVNIHFTDPRPGEMEMLAAGGFQWVRMDLTWERTEQIKERYDFTAYDRLMAVLKREGIRALFVLDYSNPLYDEGKSPYTDEGRAAFAHWAAVAAKHFEGRGILWEMYNEPNIKFWKPAPKVDDYIRLALATGKALREAAPGEVFIGPATSGVDLKFLEACFRAHLLEYWSAVSVHPYRQTAPETAASDYRGLRLLIRKYAPKGKRIPILSGEWGYSSAGTGMDPDRQGRMLARQWLTNLANDVPLSIWYDWHDDGTNPKGTEHHFGTVLNGYNRAQTPVYDPKPAYRAAQTIVSNLSGFSFNKRLMLTGPNDYLLMFTKGEDVRLAAWTTSRPHEISIPASPGAFRGFGYAGTKLKPLNADSGGLTITLSEAPIYLAPERPIDLLRIVSHWERAPLEVVVHGPSNVRLPASLRPEYRWILSSAPPDSFYVSPSGAVIPFVVTGKLAKGASSARMTAGIVKPSVTRGKKPPSEPAALRNLWTELSKFRQETYIVKSP